MRPDRQSSADIFDQEYEWRREGKELTHYLEFCETRNRDPGGRVAFSEYCEQYGYFFGANSGSEGESDASIAGTEEQKEDHKRKRTARKFATARARPKANQLHQTSGK